jgi:hypothetical protein
MYAIKKGRLYVRDMRLGGGKSSYTNNVKYAKKYPTFEQAQQSACGNESVVKLEMVWGEE